jgi:alkylhydroperoxidase family enzyme
VSEARVPRLPRADAEAAARDVEVPEVMAGLSVFQVLLHHPRLAKAVNGLLSVLLFDGRLDVRLRELVIMRIGWLSGSDYEWTQHWRVARSLGVSEEDLLAVRHGPTHPGFGPLEQAVLAAVDETVQTGRISGPTWDACERHLGGDHRVLLELVAAIGTWSMIATMLASLEVPLEDGVASWPPTGRPPGHTRPPGAAVRW